MEADFWHRRWAKNEIGFHEGQVNALLVQHFSALGCAAGCRVFVPLCGKAVDIHWLLAEGYEVVGAELSEIAIQQLFAELGLVPDIQVMGELKRYQADRLTVFVGDIFVLSRETLGQVDAVYDRAALVALIAPLRDRYAAHLQAITHPAPQLLIAFEYDQSQMPGPPFAVQPAVVELLYQTHYTLNCLARVEVPGGLKGKCPATEAVWLLR